MGFFISLVKGVNRLENFLVAFLAGLISIVVFIGVFFRYVLQDPLIWAEELALICFAWLVFIGASICTRQKAHMSIDTLVRFFPLKWVNALDWGILFLMMILSGVLIFFGFQHALYAYPTQTTALGLSWTYVFLSVPIGASLMLVHFLDEIWVRLSSPPGEGR